jgi:1-deoxy-D-xylulose-5-phosphate synthase
MVVCAPMDEKELRNMLYTAQLSKNNVPISIRYARGKGMTSEWEKPFQEIEIGNARLISEGKDLAILTIGHTGNTVSKVLKRLKRENLLPAHYDMRFIAPLDNETLHSVFKDYSHIITVEDGVLKGGFGSAVIEFMSDNGYHAELRRLGIPDYFVEHGTQDELYRECGFDEEGIELAVREMLLKIYT